MSNYTKSTNFASKDALTSGNPLKIVKGTEIDTEFNNIATAIATKSDSGGITAVASGGTGATTAAGARANLLPTFASNIGKVLAVNSSATDVEFVAAGGTGTSGQGVSTTAPDSTATRPLQIVGISKRVDNESASAYNKVLVRINTHQYGAAGLAGA